MPSEPIIDIRQHDTIVATARQLAVGLAFHSKDMSHSVFLWFASLSLPVIYAAVASFMFDAGDGSASRVSIALGAAMIGAWMTTLYGAGLVIDNQRRRGRSSCS